MLNGVHPYRLLYRDAESKVLARTSIQTFSTIPDIAESLSPEEFDDLKSTGDIIVSLALNTLKESYDRDDVLHIMRSLLDRTLRAELSKRCCNVDDLVDLLSAAGEDTALMS